MVRIKSLFLFKFISLFYLFGIFAVSATGLYFTNGPFFFLYILAICICSDIGGYIIGKKVGGKKLNDLLKLGLTEDRYVKTGNFKNYKAKKKWKKLPLDPENIKRNENDFSFNYGAAEFKYEERVSASE